MSLSDCSKCWSTPCECGWDYRKWTDEKMIEHISSIVSYRFREQAKTILLAAYDKVDQEEEWRNPSRLFDGEI